MSQPYVRVIVINADRQCRGTIVLLETPGEPIIVASDAEGPYTTEVALLLQGPDVDNCTSMTDSERTFRGS